MRLTSVLYAALIAMLAATSGPCVADATASPGPVRLTVGTSPIAADQALPGYPVGIRVTDVGLSHNPGVGYKAGIRVGDIIIRFNGHDINQGADLARHLHEIQPGSTVPIVVLRNSQETTLTAHF